MRYQAFIGFWDFGKGWKGQGLWDFGFLRKKGRQWMQNWLSAQWSINFVLFLTYVGALIRGLVDKMKHNFGIEIDISKDYMKSQIFWEQN